MSRYNDWIDISVSDDYIQRVKNEVIDYKQHLIGDIKTRWVGKVGEQALRDWCTYVKKPYTDLTQEGASFVDFIINLKNVDIKTVTRNYYPRENWACNISPEQHYQNKLVDTYVFACYVVPTQTTVLLGWISKHEFEKNAITRVANTQVTGKFKTNTELMELEISYLNIMQSL